MPKQLPPEHARFKKGQSGNPGGRPRLPPELKAVSELTADELKRTIAKYARMTKAELQAAIQDQGIPMLELYLASMLAQGAKQGDYARLTFLLDRAIGRVAGDPTVVIKALQENVAKLSDEELKQKAKEHLRALSGAKA